MLTKLAIRLRSAISRKERIDRGHGAAIPKKDCQYMEHLGLALGNPSWPPIR